MATKLLKLAEDERREARRNGQPPSGTRYDMYMNDAIRAQYMYVHVYMYMYRGPMRLLHTRSCTSHIIGPCIMSACHCASQLPTCTCT